jgi:hypothetical protein
MWLQNYTTLTENPLNWGIDAGTLSDLAAA